MTNLTATPNATATKVFNTLDEVLNSYEFKNIWEGFQGIDSRIRLLKKYEHEFVRAYVIPKDPETNYGREYNLYILDKRDYQHWFYKVEMGACLNTIQPIPMAIHGNDFYILTRENVAGIIDNLTDLILVQTKEYSL